MPINIPNFNLPTRESNPFAAGYNTSGMYNEYTDPRTIASDAMLKYSESAKNLQAIQESKAAIKAQQDKFEVDKKYQEALTNKVIAENQMSELQRKQVQDLLKQQQNEQKKILDAENTIIENEEHSIMQQNLQAKKDLEGVANMLSMITGMNRGMSMGTPDMQSMTIPQSSGAIVQSEQQPQSFFELNPEWQAGQAGASPIKVKTEKDRLEKLRGDVLERKLQEEKKPKLPPYLQNQKDKRAEAIITTKETNDVKREMIASAGEAVQRIQGGIYGKLSRKIMKNLDPNNPALGDWQTIKMVLTDAQLLNTAKTKGAISDREMALFADAAANDDIGSIPMILPVFNKLLKFMQAEEASQIKSYEHLYKENPFEWGNEEQQDSGIEDEAAALIEQYL